MKTIIIILSGILICPVFGLGLEKDSIQRDHRNNVIRFNPTPMLIWGNLRNITLSYERLIKPDQSIVFQVGYLEFDPIFEDNLNEVFYTQRKSNKGANISFDYKFYPLNRNKFAAPDGLYFGGYLSYYGFYFTDKISIVDSDPERSGEFSGGFSYINLGVELGYQFILWKRLAIDLLIFGPSLTCSVTNMNFEGNYTTEDQSEIIDALKDKVKDKYPYLSPSLDLNGERQTITFRSFFRYSVSVGICF